MKSILKFVLLGGLTLGLYSACTQPAPLPPLSSLNAPLAVQLWSFRHSFEKDVPGTLQRVRAFGFTHVELAGYYNLTAQQFKSELDKAGLKAVSMHVGFDEIQTKLDEIIRDAKLFGVTDVGVPWINSPFTKADCEKAIAIFNQAGEKLAANGLTFFYHTHGYEFVPNDGGTGTLFDLLLAKTNPKFVKLQLDTLHVAHPGQDPAELLRKFPGRFVSLHLKDLRKDKAPDNTGEVKEEDGRPLGQGKVDWPAVLKEAQAQGLKWYIIEDETPTVWEAVPQSLTYLKSVRF
ncbi:MAG: sugar phosphate isomerase/epimerase [Blastocatellia bacterium]|nr:sugar phosphate isomerase/epimerase [Blastocatellia bacterium]